MMPLDARESYERITKSDNRVAVILKVAQQSSTVLSVFKIKVFTEMDRNL